MRPLTDTVRAGLVAAAVSGVPSTIHAVATGRDPLEATYAAGSLLLPNEHRRARLVAAAIPVHLAIALGWAVTLAAVLPRRRTAVAGAAAGVGIAALDLVLVGRRFERIKALPLAPQVADHVLYGLTVGALLRD